MRVLLLLPVYNEQRQLRASVEQVLTWSATHLADHEYEVVVGDNASTDSTPQIAQELITEHPGKVRTVRLAEKGRGRMLRRVWGEENFDVSIYMDVDLATDLRHVKEAVDLLTRDKADLVIGTRLKPTSKVHGRSLKREIVSRVNVVITSILSGARVSDYQCGFKGITKRAAELTVPITKDVFWFFDTEIIAIAQRGSLRVHELPVEWTDDPTSNVNLARDSWRVIKALFAIRRDKPWKQLADKLAH